MVDVRTQDLEQIKQIFDKFGVRFLLCYGALLGHYRDGDYLPGDNDIDIAVIDPVPFAIRKKIGWMLYDLGFQTQQIVFNVFGRMEPVQVGYDGDEETGIIVCERNFKFTIFFFTEEDCPIHERELVCRPRMQSVNLISSPAKFYKELGKIKINKKEYLTPGPIEEYLEFTYGNWRDKNERKHGQTFFEMHPDRAGELINLEGKNNAAIWK